MLRKIKTLGFAVAVTCALGAVAAVGAQGATFTANAYPASGTGEQKAKNVITIQGNKVECTTVHFAGDLSAASHEITITPKYTGCVAFGFINSKVTTTGCYYKFTIDNPDNSMHFICETGKAIRIEAPETNTQCTVHISSQTPTTNSMDYANSEGGIFIEWTVAGVHTTVLKSGPFCPLTENLTDTTGKFTGSVVLKGIGGRTMDIG